MGLPEGKPVAALRGAPRTGSAERARRRCSSPCRPARGRSLVDCSHRASRITAVEKCGRCGRQLISSICCRDLTASLYLRGGVAVFWGTEVSRLRRRGARGTESGVNGRRLDEPAQALEHLPRLLLLRFATADAAVWATSDERQPARPFAIDDGLGKGRGRGRGKPASRCRPTYLTRFICTVVEASHRGGGGLRRTVFLSKASPVQMQSLAGPLQHPSLGVA